MERWTRLKFPVFRKLKFSQMTEDGQQMTFREFSLKAIFLVYVVKRFIASQNIDLHTSVRL